MCAHDARDHEPDARPRTDVRLTLVATPGGYLVVRVRAEYDPTVERWMPLHHELVGVAAVTDRRAIARTLATLGYHGRDVRALPELDLDSYRSTLP